MREPPRFLIVKNKVITFEKDLNEVKKGMNEEGLRKTQFKDITKMQLQSLDFKFGEVYLYRHCGTCDHYFIISEVRLFDP